ncbi:MAG: hypothetical protein PHV63_01455 [Candidatus Daviesbacteria bacterium]|nr:hypothetical protein [Candidatus Daviesbacteria bacterium]
MVIESGSSHLRQAIIAYDACRDRLTPQLVTAYWRTKFRVNGAKVGLDIVVPDCDWTEEEIRRPMMSISGEGVLGMMVYRPPEITLPLLNRLYPLMGMATDFVEEDSLVIDTHGTTGWIKVEASINAPNCNTFQKDLKNFIERSGYFGQRLIVYILASQASKDLTGRYFDQEPIYCRLFGSRYRSRVISAGFDPSGYLGFDWRLDPNFRDRFLGARFEEIKR